MSEPLRPHLNTGAPFKRKDGSTWGRKAVHVPSPSEFRQRRYKLRPVNKTVEPAVPVRNDGWPLAMEPELYLELHPTGSHAEQALALVTDDEVEVGVESVITEEDTDGVTDE